MASFTPTHRWLLSFNSTTWSVLFLAYRHHEAQILLRSQTGLERSRSEHFYNRPPCLVSHCYQYTNQCLARVQYVDFPRVARCSSHRSDIDHCGKFWNAVINSLPVHGWRHASRPESAVVLRFPCDSAFSLVRLVNCLSRSCHVCFSVFVFLVSQAWCCTAPLLLVDIYRRTLIM